MEKIYINKRVFIYTAAAFFLFFLRIVATFSFSWFLSGKLQEIIQIISAVLALIICVMALTRYYAKKDTTFLFIATAFLGTFIFDSYNAIIANSSGGLNLFPLPKSLGYLSWISSKLYLSLILFLSWWLWRREEKDSKQRKISESHIYLTSSILILGIFIFFNFTPLLIKNHFIISQPHELLELIPALLFLLSLAGYINKKYWKADYFEHFLILFIIINLAVQTIFIPFSTESFDVYFYFAILLNIVGYIIVLIGLITDTYKLYKQTEQSEELLISQNLSLKETRIQYEEALKNSLLKETELSSKIQDLENTKKAIFNLNQDLNEENLKVEKAKAKDEAFVSSIGDGMIIGDEEGNILMTNDQAKKMLDYNETDLVGKKLSEVIQMKDDKGDIVPPEKRPIQLALSSGKKIVNNAYSYIRKNGTIIPVAITASPVILNNQIEGTIIVFRDIAKEKEVDRMKTEFISLASHQLRTPLSAIRWYSEMLLDGDAGQLNKEQKEFTRNIDESTKRMFELINALLNISRIESGRIIIDPEPTDLVQLVHDLLNELKPKLELKKQKLIISQHENLPKINIDPKLIRQVYSNLLTNAIKYTKEEGEISVFISKKDNEIISQVSDNGYGIPEKDINKIFQRFYRGENIVKIETDGTGLGLYLIKAIIESSKGRIWFKSEEGKGTTFWFSLPISGTPPKKGEVTIDT